MAALLSTLLAIVMSVEYSRKNWPKVNELIVLVMGPVMRQTEVDRVTGIPFYLASCLFSVLVFPQYIQVIAILHLVFGDPFSSFFGVLFGRDKLFPNKSLQGTLGGLLVCALATGFFLKVIGVPSEVFLLLTLIGGFSGAIAELLPLNIDDNFAIPVVSGLIMTLAFWAANVPLGP
jgi:dolichol kinase